MGDWNVFLATCAGSAATLAGLLFVATQLHIDVFTDRTNRWAALAQSTLTILSSVLALSLTFLIPMLPLQVKAEVAMAVAAVALIRTVRLWWPVVRIAEKGRWHRIEQSFWLLLVPILVYIYLLFGTILLFRGDQIDGLITEAVSFLAMFAVSLRNSWRLVISVARENR
jgi:hypothetical protein